MNKTYKETDLIIRLARLGGLNGTRSSSCDLKLHVAIAVMQLLFLSVCLAWVFIASGVNDFVAWIVWMLVHATTIAPSGECVTFLTLVGVFAVLCASLYLVYVSNAMNSTEPSKLEVWFREWREKRCVRVNIIED